MYRRKEVGMPVLKKKGLRVSSCLLVKAGRESKVKNRREK